MVHALLDPSTQAEVTEAEGLASRNFAANRRALARSQPIIEEHLPSPGELSWTFGRDGYLTAQLPDGLWHSGCSVPLLAGRAILKSMDPGGGSVCFLNPEHAAQIRVAFEHLERNQALICIVAGDANFAPMLYCDDFSAEITAGRLWFARGAGWVEDLAKLLDDAPGLPTPSRFVRLPRIDQEILQRTISEAQRVFTDCGTRRASAIGDLRAGWKAREAAVESPRICIVARSMFRLWDDAGDALNRAMSDSSTAPRTLFDPDDASQCSPLALATVATASDVVIAADLARADLPAGLAPAELPWITWVTTPRIPPFAAAGPNDQLLVAEPAWRSNALAAGWPADRVDVARWPAKISGPADVFQPTDRVLAIIVDTCAAEPPEAVTDFSSHTLLWEKLERLIAHDPFAVPADPAAWVAELARSEGIDPAKVDLQLFVNRLVLPSYAQAIADMLIAAGLPLRIYGSGWTDLARFSSHAMGELSSRDELDDVVRRAGALVHVWPSADGRQIDTLGRPVVRRTGRWKEAFIREARLALAGKATTTSIHPSDGAPLSLGLLLDRIAKTSRD